MKKELLAVVIISVSGVFVRAQNDQMQTNQPSGVAPVYSRDYSEDYVHHLSAGVQLGEPFGATAKYWITDMYAVDAAAGWSPAGHSDAEIHADFLAHDFNLLSPSEGKLPLYIGGGILGRFRDDGRGDMAGWRFPVGISYLPENCRLEPFAEVAPEIIFTPFARGGIDGCVGIRYRF